MKYPDNAAAAENTLKKIAITAILLAGLGLASIAHGLTTVSTSFTTPVHVQTSLSTSGCENNPGPTVTLTGAVSLGGMGVQLIFKNNLKGTHTHTEETTATVTVIPQGQSMQIPKQPVQGGTGGNPFISIQFVDKSNNPLSSEIFLGRCVQGLFNTSVDFTIPSLATAQVSAQSCDNTGSTITLSGQLALTGIKANIIFRNNDNPVGGPHQNTQPTTVSVVIIPEGQSITFAKQPPLGGVGGNPLISLVFLNSQGQPASDEFLLGRCNQL